MRTVETEKTEATNQTDASHASDRSKRPRVVASSAARWLSERLALPDTIEPQGPRRARLAAICVCIFLLAFVIRLFYWQDNYARFELEGPWIPGVLKFYKTEAQRMLNEGAILYPNGPVDPGDARLILHPPGYSAFMAAIFAVCGDSLSMVMLAQFILDALSAVMIFLIAAELLNLAVAIIAAVLVALSPHLAYYTIWLTPDSLCVLPILVAVYLVIKANKRPRLITVIAAGAMVGLSLWLRANALLLAPFLAVATMVLIARGKRLRYGAALIGATILVISPITIRNWILFHHFIPISIAGGENLVVGIADLDKEGRFGMPNSDGDAAIKDAQWHNRPDYADNPWFPDGVARDQARYARGLEVIRSNPGWFLRAMFQRALFMLRYNDSGRSDWPFNTARAPIVSAEPPAMNSPASIRERQPAWSATALDLLAGDSILSRQAEVRPTTNPQTLLIIGDGSQFGDQFTSSPIAVKPNTDYLLTVQLALEQGPVAAKVTSSDRRIALASAIPRAKEKRLKRKKNSNAVPDDSTIQDRMDLTQMIFASGDRSEVRLVISNNGPSSARPVTQVGQVELFDLGATPYRWTRYPRAFVRGLQKNLFKTGTMLPLVIAGLLLLLLARRGRSLVVLLAVPAYYLCVHSALSTEYRYILAIHYFLFILAAATLFCAAKLIKQGTQLLIRRVGIINQQDRISLSN